MTQPPPRQCARSGCSRAATFAETLCDKHFAEHLADEEANAQPPPSNPYGELVEAARVWNAARVALRDRGDNANADTITRLIGRAGDARNALLRAAERLQTKDEK